MKSIFKALIGCACISLFCFSTCSKKDDDPKNGNAAIEAKIAGKWQFDYSVFKVTDRGVVSFDTLYFEDESALNLNGDKTYSFKMVGKYPSFVNESGSGTWKLSDDGKTLLSDPSAMANADLTINNLTTTALTLYYKDVDGTFTGERFFYFKR